MYKNRLSSLLIVMCIGTNAHAVYGPFTCPSTKSLNAAARPYVVEQSGFDVPFSRWPSIGKYNSMSISTGAFMYSLTCHYSDDISFYTLLHGNNCFLTGGTIKKAGVPTKLKGGTTNCTGAGCKAYCEE